MSQPIRFRTARMQWSVRFDRLDHNTTATVTASPLASAGTQSSVEDLSPQSFTVTESDQDTLMERIHSEIERRDGAVLVGSSDEDEDRQ